MDLEDSVATHDHVLHELNAVYESFVPREFLEFLHKDNITEVKAGDQVQREMTVLFMDIRDFTSLSERMTPQENFNFLNNYLAHIMPAIRKMGGFIDKFIGDAVMALFPKNPDSALHAAVMMRQALSRYNIQLRSQNYAPISVGIGIHTGKMMLGVIGDKTRMQSTVISDAVNLASRLEGLTKVYGASIVISKQSFLRITDNQQFASRSVGKIQVKGKNQPVSVYEIFDGDNEKSFHLKQKTKKTL